MSAVYVESLDVVLRSTERWDDRQPTRVLVGTIDVGDEVPLDDLFRELHAWLNRERGGAFVVQQRRSIAEVGATGIGTEIVIALLGAAGGVTLESIWQLLKDRLSNPAAESNRRAYLLSLEHADLAQSLAATVAQAIGARAAELQLVELRRDADEIRGTYETSTGERYTVRLAGEELFEIALHDEDG